MTWLAVILACAAAWVAVGSPRALPETDTLPPRRGGLTLVVVVGVIGGLAAVVMAFGPRAGGFTLVGAFVVGTALLLVRRRLRERAMDKARAEVTRAASVIAGLLRVGMVPEQALRMAAEECAVIADAARALDVGADAGPALRVAAGHPGHAGLLTLARAWELCRLTGAPVAPVIDRVAESMRADHKTQSTVIAELAAPRATGQLMAFLPVVGIGMGYMAGGDPIDFLTSTLPGLACLVVGVGLACGGVLWTERLARRQE